MVINRSRPAYVVKISPTSASTAHGYRFILGQELPLRNVVGLTSEHGNAYPWSFISFTNNARRCYQVGERQSGGKDVLRACSGANAALEELVALTEDFKQEVSKTAL